MSTYNAEVMEKIIILVYLFKITSGIIQKKKTNEDIENIYITANVHESMKLLLKTVAYTEYPIRNVTYFKSCLGSK